MPRKRTWLFVAAAALLLWLRPWRRVARRLRGAAQSSPGTPHPEVAFSSAGEVPGAEPIGAILDRGTAAIERAASDQAAILGEPGPGPDAAEFAGPAFFGPGEAPEGEPDLIDSMLALEDEPDADALLTLDDEPDAAAALDAVDPAEADALPAGPAAAEADAAGAIPAGHLNLSADAPGTLVAGPAAKDEAAVLEAEGGEAAPGRPDDLLVIEGIGPRTSTIVTAAGITSFAQLAEADVETLRAALVDAGIKTVDPSTWPEQGRLAADGRWDELKQLQGRIKNGRKQ